MGASLAGFKEIVNEELERSKFGCNGIDSSKFYVPIVSQQLGFVLLDCLFHPTV